MCKNPYLYINQLFKNNIKIIVTKMKCLKKKHVRNKKSSCDFCEG